MKHSPREAATIRVERALHRLHTVLRLTELDAPQLVIAGAQALFERSLAEIHLSEVELVQLYPAFRFAVLARQARENEVN